MKKLSAISSERFKRRGKLIFMASTNSWDAEAELTHSRSRSRHDNDPNRAIAAGRKWRAADRRKRSRRHAHRECRDVVINLVRDVQKSPFRIKRHSEGMLTGREFRNGRQAS